ncbi:Endonuclease [Tenacibaculum litopenaei]|uniref:DNA/RNA non-specific endonuclease n=1 Tax=Tenacibaculum litopenaei TaxID=396016 RepID=UPI0038950AE1
MTLSRSIKLGLTLVGVGYFAWKRYGKHFVATNTETAEVTVQQHDEHGALFTPNSTTGVHIKHQGYQLSYNEQHEQAEWVAYTLNKNDFNRNKFKRPYFTNDPKVRTKSADWKSYKKSGYDKGHLCPAGDRKSSKAAYNETFYTSNVSPQTHEFNAGIWHSLENKIRHWAAKNKQLYIVTGGVLTGELKTIGKRNKVSVPNYFYKIVLDYSSKPYKTIAFLMPHKASKRSIYNYVVSIDEIEKVTGIDFFSKLDDSLENKLEAQRNYQPWLL